ncbi:MAG: hypothetical protein ABI581_13645 [Sediminibacterium sp.]
MENTNSLAGRRVVLVHWKNTSAYPFEVYSNLKNFCLSHPEFRYDTVNNYLSKKKLPYETEMIRIERKPVITKASPPPKPDLPKRLFWEFKYDEMNWQSDYATVIERVVERGSPEEWDEMIRFYGQKKVKNTIKNEITYLTDKAIKKVTTFFDFKPEELKCYIRKQSRQKLWI